MRLGRRCGYRGSGILPLVLTMTWVLYHAFKRLDVLSSSREAASTITTELPPQFKVRPKGDNLKIFIRNFCRYFDSLIQKFPFIFGIKNYLKYI
jgi:hypothetical protein